MKKEYFNPEFEVCYFESEDIITASGLGVEDEQNEIKGYNDILNS